MSGALEGSALELYREQDRAGMAAAARIAELVDALERERNRSRRLARMALERRAIVRLLLDQIDRNHRRNA